MKTKRDWILRRYPVFDAYSADHEHLDREGAAATNFEGRIKSIWNFIVRRCTLFARSLSVRDQAYYDPEDVIAEIVIALAERDDKWTPDRGKYITFAGVIMDREFFAMRDKAKMVVSPRNSSCRLKEYERESEDGTITDRRAKTAEDIRRAQSGAVDLPTTGGQDGGSCCTADVKLMQPHETMSRKEASIEAGRALRAAIAATLTTFEAVVISRLSGINGREPESAWFIAWTMQRDETEVRRAKERAYAKIRRYLTEAGHPLAA